eukprot:3651951-Prorocentrum_lima.AAC.1
MTSSLVGSEMCIRDRGLLCDQAKRSHWRRTRWSRVWGCRVAGPSVLAGGAPSSILMRDCWAMAWL